MVFIVRDMVWWLKTYPYLKILEIMVLFIILIGLNYFYDRNFLSLHFLSGLNAIVFTECLSM